MHGMPRDTKTRFEGVYARHQARCAVEHGGDCDCSPSYWGKAWDRSTQRPIKTAFLPSPTSAKAARDDLIRALRDGNTPMQSTMRVKAAVERYVQQMRDGVALNKHGRRYKANALRDIEQALDLHVVSRPEIATKRVGDVRRGHVQAIVDDLHAAGLSGSRIRTVVNAIRSFYGWAQDRDLCDHDPAGRVRLPAMDATPRDRIATPAEMVSLLAELELEDRLAYALAAYTGARRDEIRHAALDDVALDTGVIYLGADDEARKSRAALRAVPLVAPARELIRETLLQRALTALVDGEQPQTGGRLCPARRDGSTHRGLLSFEALQKRADHQWGAAREERELEPLRRITAHECRHTFITWCDAAGIRPKVVSRLAGHSTSRGRDGGAEITQARYTHVLPGDLEEARKLLDAYLIEQTRSRTPVD